MPIQEKVSQCASSNRGDGRDDDDPEEIQPSMTRGEHSAHRKDGNAPEIEGIGDHRSSRNAEHSGSPDAREQRERAGPWSVKLGLSVIAPALISVGPPAVVKSSTPDVASKAGAAPAAMNRYLKERAGAPSAQYRQLVPRDRPLRDLPG